MLSCLRAARRRLRLAVNEQTLSLRTRERFSYALERLRSEASALVEELSLLRGMRLAAIVAAATQEIRRESGRGSRGLSEPIRLEGPGDMGGARIPREEVAAWRDLFCNFVRNALQACEEKDTPAGAPPPAVIVRIHPLAGRGGTTVEVADGGLGMSPAVLDSMWRGGLSRHGPGRGEGLTEAKREFLLARASCEVRSVPGVGTAVCVEVPDRTIGIPPVPLQKTRPAQVLLAVVAVALATGALASRQSSVTSFDVAGGSALVGRDDRNKIVWKRDLRETISENEVYPEAGHPSNRPPVLRGPGGRVSGTIVATQPAVGPGRL